MKCLDVRTPGIINRAWLVTASLLPPWTTQENHCFQSRDSQVETTTRTSSGRKLELQLINFWRLSMKKPNKYKLQGNQLCTTPTLLWISPPVPLAGRGGKELLWNMAQHSVLLNKACPQEKILNQSLASRGFIRASSKRVGNTKF